MNLLKCILSVSFVSFSGHCALLSPSLNVINLVKGSLRTFIFINHDRRKTKNKSFRVFRDISDQK